MSDRGLTVMRCMSKAELVAYCKGEVMRNLSTHPGQRTNSIGFCFFPVSHASDRIVDRLRYLAGIVNMEVVAVFETIPPARLTVAEGYYANPIAYDKLDLLEIFNMPAQKKTEYCSTVYDKDMLKLLAVGTPYRDMASGEWRVHWHKGGKIVERREGQW